MISQFEWYRGYCFIKTRLKELRRVFYFLFTERRNYHESQKHYDAVIRDRNQN